MTDLLDEIYANLYEREDEPDVWGDDYYDDSPIGDDDWA